jgi:hypothetical protein
LVGRFGYPLKFSIAAQGFAHSAANSGGDESNFYVASNNPGGPAPGNIYFNATGTPIMTGLSGNRVGFASLLGWMFIMDSLKQGRHNGTTLHNWGIAAPTTALTCAIGAAHTGGTTGQYSFYYTYVTNDQFYETGPSPVSNIITTAGNDIDFSGVTFSSDPEMVGGSRNIYAVGGNLGAAYLVATIPDNTSTTSIAFPAAGYDNWNTNDLIATNEGITMPGAHDPPPGGAGLAGPYLSRLYTWVGNRLYYTPPGLPQYWSTDAAVGDWVDVGEHGENIQWCVAHTNVLMIYKQKSIWRLIGDPLTGTLEQVEAGVGLCNAFAVTPGAGGIDYFVSPNGLRRCNLDRSELFGTEISPLFNSPIVNNNSTLGAPGSILPGALYAPTGTGTAWTGLGDLGGDSIDAYGLALGYAMGKLYVSYNENTAPYLGNATSGAVTAVYDEQSKQWMYHRNTVTAERFHGFYFDGALMIGLTGMTTFVTGVAVPTGSLGWSIDDFRLFYTGDEWAGAGVDIESVYQSHFEDAGQPDNQKCWLEVGIDCVVGAGVTATVYATYDNGTFSPIASIGTIVGTGGRQVVAFPLGTNGVLAKNISVTFGVPSSVGGLAELHNVYLYYYLETRLAISAATLPTDLGTAAVKQCKELILDIDTSYSGGGTVVVNLSSDLPGNALAVQHSPIVPVLGGRALYKFPFAVTMGYLWRVALTASSRPFRLYSVRLLMRAIGTYVEAYESAAGFVFDTGPLTFESGITHIPKAYAIALAAVPIKRYREISLEMETFGGAVTVTFLTDLPGESLTARFSATVNTGALGRTFVRLPLPAGILAPIEGRMCQLLFSGASSYILYDGAVEVLAVGVYVEAYEAAGGAVYDSREIDFGSAKPKEARELELDIETTGAITATLYCDLPGYTMAQCFVNTAVSTTGRQKIKLPLSLSTAPFAFPMGRLFRLILTGSNAFRLYDAKLLLREFGCYLTGDEASASPIGVFDTTPMDCGTERLKEFKKLELEIQCDTGGTATLNLWTDQPAGAMTIQYTTTITTAGGHQTVKIPLWPGIRGRLLQIEISGSGVRLFAGRVWMRPLNESKAQWTWVPLPIPPTAPQWAWMPFTVNPTEAQWFWAKVLSIQPTTDTYNAVDVPFEVTG